jgi:hypothetical protein
MKEHILFKLATRSRPEKARASINNIIENCKSDNFTILVSVDFDDDSMKNFSYVHSNVTIIYGISKSKIDAINRDLDIVKDWDILINTSDDMVFTNKGFDNIIRQDFKGNLDQFIHYSDGNQKENISTMSIMGKEYYDRFNYIYHPDYKSLWCDAEATEVAVLLGKYRYMGDNKILFRHMHPAWGLAESDAQYQKTEAPEMWEHDYKVILERKARNYDLPQHLIINPPKYAKL